MKNNLKEGDKIICIKDYSFDHGYGSGKVFKGEEYEYNFFIGCMLVDLNEDFNEHFITLAEWREKQINSILDG